MTFDAVLERTRGVQLECREEATRSREIASRARGHQEKIRGLEYEIDVASRAIARGEEDFSIDDVRRMRNEIDSLRDLIQGCEKVLRTECKDARERVVRQMEPVEIALVEALHGECADKLSELEEGFTGWLEERLAPLVATESTATTGEPLADFVRMHLPTFNGPASRDFGSRSIYIGPGSRAPLMSSQGRAALEKTLGSIGISGPDQNEDALQVFADGLTGEALEHVEEQERETHEAS